jgi:hypothetical protein
MVLPARNTTCDIYRHDSCPPPSDPDVAGVPCHLVPSFSWAASTLSGARWTHCLLVGPEVDIRDDYQGADTFGTSADSVWIPDQDGIEYRVVFVETVGSGSASAHKRVYLDRQTVSDWGEFGIEL